MAKKKDAAKAKGAEVVVDPMDAVEGGESQLPVPSSEGSNNTKDMMASVGMDGSFLSSLDLEVTKRREADPTMASLLDVASDDITRAKSQEDFAAIDVARTEVLADVALETALITGNFQEGMEILAAKKHSRADLLKTMAVRKKMESDDFEAQKQRTVLQVINKVVEVLTQALLDDGIDKDRIDAIVVKVSEQATTMVDTV